jgi:hypothetical protein
MPLGCCNDRSGLLGYSKDLLCKHASMDCRNRCMKTQWQHIDGLVYGKGSFVPRVIASVPADMNLELINTN